MIMIQMKSKADRNLVCQTRISYPEPEPNLFSFNSPYGAHCNGLGINKIVDFEKVIEINKIYQGRWNCTFRNFRNNWILMKLLNFYIGSYDIDTPIAKIDAQILGYILNGTKI